jgi:MauM/NapG family ferredoxin protein
MSPTRRTANHFFPPLRAKDRTGWRKWADRLTRALGPSWRAAPLRRGIQTASFLLFGYLFFYVSWPYAETFTSEVLPGKERLPVELFLWLDPLVGASTAIAARVLNVALVGTVAVLLLNVFVPRGFCGYVCPLGTLVDLFDWLLGRHAGRLKLRKPRGLSQFSRSENGTVPFARKDGWWIHLKYYVLAAVLAAAVFGVLLSGFVSAIPVVTRGMAFTLGTIELGWLRSWTQVRGFGPGDWLSIGLFLAILAGGFLRKRFWCRYVCPTGAVFSLASVLRWTHRRVETTCAGCGRCVEICPFDAIAEDYSTRTSDCTWCQTCGGACPVGAIRFVGRIGEQPEGRNESEVRARRRASRRGFLAAAIGGAAAALGLRAADAAELLRPPGSVPEPAFLDLCVRCGQCLQVCPGPVLQPAGWGAPAEALWTPVAVLTHAGCHQDCNFCTQVCPTGAIRPLSIEEKRKTSMGLAVIDQSTCLPHAGVQDCRLCVDECDAAGYGAIELRTIRLPMENVPEGVFTDEELELMGRIDAPFVDPDACVGCGLCEYRCHAAVVKQEKLLARSAVRVVAENVDRHL